jgi:hypothetical protein
MSTTSAGTTSDEAKRADAAIAAMAMAATGGVNSSAADDSAPNTANVSRRNPTWTPRLCL